MIGGDKGILAAVAGRAAKRRALGLSLSGREGGTSGGGGEPPPPAPSSPYGPMYSNWDGSYINFNITATASTTPSSFGGLDSFYDPINNRLYDAYASNNSYRYYNALIPTANTTAEILPNRPTTNGGRGCTVAYQNGSSYLLMTQFSGNRVNVWKIETGGTYTYKGHMIGSASTNGGIAFAYYNNTAYFFTGSVNQAIIYRHALPDLESLSGQSITQDRAYTLTNNLGYNLSFIGEDGNGDLYFVFKYYNGATYINKIAKTEPTASSFSSVAVSSNISGYSLWIDYATPTLYAGGLVATSAYFWTT